MKLREIAPNIDRFPEKEDGLGIEHIAEGVFIC